MLRGSGLAATETTPSTCDLRTAGDMVQADKSLRLDTTLGAGDIEGSRLPCSLHGSHAACNVLDAGV